MCLFPINIRNPYYYCNTTSKNSSSQKLNEFLTYDGHNVSRTHFIQVPCGKCVDCKKQKQNEWYVRLMYHLRLYDPKLCSFVTLTYNDAFLPYAVDKETGEATPTLLKRDAQLFIKRLRKKYDKPFTYFLCGEYGSKRSRPHLHLLIFGMSPNDCFTYVPDAWKTNAPYYYDEQEKQVKYYECNLNKRTNQPKARLQMIPTKIGRNYISTSPLGNGSLRYVVKYCTKFTLASTKPVQEEIDSYKRYLISLHNENLTEHYNLIQSLTDGTQQEHDDFFNHLFFEDLNAEKYPDFQKTFRLCSQHIGENIKDDPNYVRIVNDPILRKKTYNTFVEETDKETGQQFKYSLPRYMRLKLYNEQELAQISQDALIRNYIRNQQQLDKYYNDNYQELLHSDAFQILQAQKPNETESSLVYELATIKMPCTRQTPDYINDKQRTLLTELFKDYAKDFN